MTRIGFPKPTKRIKKRKRLRKISAKSMTVKLDNLVREIFRKRYEPVCYVCGARNGWFSITNKYGIQVGHYIARGVFNLRWDFNNLYPQCSSCNTRHNDNPNPFRNAIIKKEGEERMQYLDKKYEEHLQMKTLVKLPQKMELYESLKKELGY